MCVCFLPFCLAYNLFFGAIIPTYYPPLLWGRLCCAAWRPGSVLRTDGRHRRHLPSRSARLDVVCRAQYRRVKVQPQLAGQDELRDAAHHAGPVPLAGVMSRRRQSTCTAAFENGKILNIQIS